MTTRADTASLDQTAETPALLSLVGEAAAAASPKPAPRARRSDFHEFDPNEEPPLYAARRKLYPQSVHGTFRRIKWIVLVLTLGVYYVLPFIRWDRGPNAPDQAVLIDFPTRRFYFFFIEIWPQEFYYITGLLVLAAMILFLMNAVAGRVWCGYLCPQTVWTDLFYMIERFVEGDRREHLRRDTAPWSFEKAARKGVKHFLWLMVAWWTGGAWVLYFSDAPTLVVSLATGTAPFIAYLWIGILTFTTYTLAGHMREQVCIYMCPWPRIQAALIDDQALNVTYRYDRGEPRGSLKQNTELRRQGLPAGDCIDCLQCVHVCPTGVDIRDGPNLGCIQCGLCIDACDSVMDKIGRPRRLIAYDTDLNIKRRQSGEKPIFKIVRARTLIYAVIIAVVGGFMLATFATRNATGISIGHDRNPLYVRLSDGSLRNAYTMRIINKDLEPRVFRLYVSGIDNATVDVQGEPDSNVGFHDIEVGPDKTREVRVLVTAHPPVPSEAVPMTFLVVDTKSDERAEVTDYFHGPGN